jgi:hypothetical protein
MVRRIGNGEVAALILHGEAAEIFLTDFFMVGLVMLYECLSGQSGLSGQ